MKITKIAKNDRRAKSDAIKQKVFALRLKGLSYQLIADKTKVSIPTIGVWIRAAVKANPRKNKGLVFKLKTGPRPTHARI